jgi:hypothetical protein
MMLIVRAHATHAFKDRYYGLRFLLPDLITCKCSIAFFGHFSLIMNYYHIYIIPHCRCAHFSSKALTEEEICAMFEEDNAADGAVVNPPRQSNIVSNVEVKRPVGSVVQFQTPLPKQQSAQSLYGSPRGMEVDDVGDSVSVCEPSLGETLADVWMRKLPLERIVGGWKPGRLVQFAESACDKLQSTEETKVEARRLRKFLDLVIIASKVHPVCLADMDPTDRNDKIDKLVNKGVTLPSETCEILYSVSVTQAALMFYGTPTPILEKATQLVTMNWPFRKDGIEATCNFSHDTPFLSALTQAPGSLVAFHITYFVEGCFIKGIKQNEESAEHVKMLSNIGLKAFEKHFTETSEMDVESNDGLASAICDLMECFRCIQALSDIDSTESTSHESIQKLFLARESLEPDTISKVAIALELSSYWNPILIDYYNHLGGVRLHSSTIEELKEKLKAHSATLDVPQNMTNDIASMVSDFLALCAIAQSYGEHIRELQLTSIKEELWNFASRAFKQFFNCFVGSETAKKLLDDDGACVQAGKSLDIMVAPLRLLFSKKDATRQTIESWNKMLSNTYSVADVLHRKQNIQTKVSELTLALTSKPFNEDNVNKRAKGLLGSIYGVSLLETDEAVMACDKVCIMLGTMKFEKFLAGDDADALLLLSTFAVQQVSSQTAQNYALIELAIVYKEAVNSFTELGDDFDAQYEKDLANNKAGMLALVSAEQGFKTKEKECRCSDLEWKKAVKDCMTDDDELSAGIIQEYGH